LGVCAPYTSATNAVHGHALGASGAIGTILCLKAIAAGWVPGTHNLSVPDPAVSQKLVGAFEAEGGRRILYDRDGVAVILRAPAHADS